MAPNVPICRPEVSFILAPLSIFGLVATGIWDCAFLTRYSMSSQDGRGSVLQPGLGETSM